MFAVEVVAPVIGEVVIGDQGPQVQDGFGSFQTPAGSGDVEAIADQVAAGTLDGAGGDWPPLGECMVVVKEFGMAGQVADARVDLGPVGGERGDLSLEGGDDLLGVAGQEGQGAGGDPVLGSGIGWRMQAPCAGPELLDDMDEVDHDVDGDVPAGGFGADQVELVAGAVDQHHPGASVPWVAGP